MTYADIVGIGMGWAQSFCPWLNDGTAIKFSTLCSGFPALTEQIERKRPDLFDDAPDERA